MITFHPLTPEHWADFEKLFSRHAACGGCCMYGRQSQAELTELQVEPNRISINASWLHKVLRLDQTRLILRDDLPAHHPLRS